MNKFARITAIGVSAIIGVSALTACTSGTTPETTPSPTATSAAPLDRNAGTNYSMAEEVFIETYESEYGTLSGPDKDALLDLGYGTCDTLTAGASIEDIFMDLYDEGLNLDEMEEAGFIAGSAVVSFCPEFTEEMMDFANAAGAGEYV